MRRPSAVLVIVALLLWAGLSAIGPAVHLTVPGTGDGWQTAKPGLPIIPFGDDGGGSH